ncbi:MAG: hypothetical protein ACRDTH_09075 [Pseudonocardiaceae bacterium]
MSDPRTPVGGAGVRESVSGRLDWIHDTADTSPPVTPAESLPGRCAGLCACCTAPLRRRCGWWSREVAPDGPLPLSERVRGAEAARKAHRQRLALASVRARGVSRQGVASG